MPHQCTNCGRTFADGSKEMLSGCPDCDGTKFQFRPDGFDDAPDSSAGSSKPPGDGVSRTVGNAAATVRDLVSGSAGPGATDATPPGPADATADGTTDRTADGTADDGGSDDDIIVAESPGEDSAQADARSQVAGPGDLPESGGFDPSVDEEGDSAPSPETADAGASVEDGANAGAGDGTADRTVAGEPDAEAADRPDLAQLREELNDQFESIRIVERGQYELNLMELYDRDEVIVALQEDGRYSIRVPEAIGEADV